MSRKRMIACTLFFLYACSLLASGQKEIKTKGMISSRNGDQMTIRTRDGDRTVLLTDDTKAEVPSGMFRHKETSMAELMPGLAVEVQGVEDGDTLVAKRVRYDKDDLRTANAIQAGLAPTQQHVATNRENIAANKERVAANRQQIEVNQAAVEQRFSDLTDFEVKGNTVIHFATGKANLSKQSQAALLELSNNAKNLKGYLIEVKGYCDSTGNPAQNQELSRDRAEAVVEFLHQQGQIPVRRVMAPGAMAVTEPVASNETASGRAENRRVEVKVLVNRGLAASAQ